MKMTYRKSISFYQNTALLNSILYADNFVLLAKAEHVQQEHILVYMQISAYKTKTMVFADKYCIQYY